MAFWDSQANADSSSMMNQVVTALLLDDTFLAIQILHGGIMRLELDRDATMAAIEKAWQENPHLKHWKILEGVALLRTKTFVLHMGAHMDTNLSADDVLRIVEDQIRPGEMIEVFDQLDEDAIAILKDPDSNELRLMLVTTMTILAYREVSAELADQFYDPCY